MHEVQFFSLFATTLVGFGVLYREMNQIKKKIREDIIVHSQNSEKHYKNFEAQKLNSQKFHKSKHP